MDVPFRETVQNKKITECCGRQVRPDSEELLQSHVKLEKSMKHPNGDVKSDIGYMSVEPRAWSEPGI